MRLGFSLVIILICSSLSHQQNIRVIRNLDENIKLKSGAISTNHISEDTLKRMFEGISESKLSKRGLSETSGNFFCNN